MKMFKFKALNTRRLSITGFSFLFAYILSFQFEGQVLYNLLEMREINASSYIMAAMIAHFVGLLTCGLFVRSWAAAKSMMLGGMGALKIRFCCCVFLSLSSQLIPD